MSVILVKSKNQFFALLYVAPTQILLPSWDVLPFDIALIVCNRFLIEKQELPTLPIYNTTINLNTNTQTRRCNYTKYPKYSHPNKPPCKKVGLFLFPLPIGIRANYLSTTVRKQHVLMCMHLKPPLCDTNVWYQVCLAFLGL